jgi:PAS domain S-box-containing protein
MNTLPPEVRNWIGRQLFRHVPANIAVIDREFRLVAANENFTQVFGEAVGDFCHRAYKRRDAVCEHCLASLTFEDGKVRINDETGVDKNGRLAHYVVHIAPVFDEQGGIPYIIEMSYDVTETKNLQGQYNLLFERVPCYVNIINRDFRIVRANELLRKTFGDTTGQHCYEVLKRQDHPCENCPALKTFQDGKSYTRRQVGRDKDGKLTYYIVSTAPLSRGSSDFDHVIEMAVDYTEEKKLSERLEVESSLRHSLTESALDAVLAADEKGIVRVFNPAAEKLFGISAAEVKNVRRVWRFLPAEFAETMQSGGRSLLLPETTINNAAGEEIPVRLSGSLLRDGETVIGGAAFLQDLRELKRLEKEKLENERLAAVGSTVAQLAHGIKNILTGLQGGLYVIKSGIKKGDQTRTEKGWGMLERNVERITTMVKGFLSFSKGYIPEAKPVDPNTVAEEVHHLYESAAAKKGIRLLFEPAADLEPASMDPEDMHTCLANLVSNAMDACQSCEKSELSVTIRVRDENGAIVYEVVDTGVGMDYEIKNKVFTTFFTTKGLGGTGLGLMVTRKIVQEHGGKIEVESQPGVGSVFRIRLPRERLPQPAPAKDDAECVDGE